MQTETHYIFPYGFIYKLTNKQNGKPYIGQALDLDRRWNDYHNLRNCKSQRKLYNAFLAYGPNNFIYEAIDAADNQNNLDELEDEYILIFDSINNGYNCRRGGRCGIHSDETKKKISDANKGKNNPNYGKTLSKETKNKMSSAKIGILNHNFRKQFSKETKNKMSKVKKGKYKGTKRQYLDDGSYIMIKPNVLVLEQSL